MVNRKCSAVRRAGNSVGRSVRKVRRRWNAKRAVPDGRKKSREPNNDARTVDAFGGIDIAIGQSWFSPRGRK